MRTRRIDIGWALWCVGGCSAGGAAGAMDPCPRDGIVPAEFRDVERDAEGVSYAAFGAYPDRTPDLARAAGVFGLLQQVWRDGQDRCPAFPSTTRDAIDDAIGSLSQALTDADAHAAALAANAIHLQMAPSFAYFQPDTPTEVVEMDALFLRVGLSAFYGDGQQYDADVATLQRDWAALKPAAEARVPTCHRVAGTATVVGDLDDTLAALAGAAGASDVDLAQVQSDAGLLEVDILELLYDCVPDGEHPSSGVGAPCRSVADCDPSQVCDLDNGGGTCAPDPDNTHVGQPCTTTVDCGSDPRSAYNNEVGDGFPGGYCILEPCDDAQVCPPGATCVALPFETPSCMATCVDDGDCRSDAGYVCQLFPVTPPVGFGPSERACAFACTDDAGCTPPLSCETASGRCVP